MSIFGKTINRFNRPKTKVERAVSRAFFNNGYKVEKHRLRISDGTPVGSTGLPRLMKDFRTAGIVSVGFISAVITNFDWPAIISTGIGSIVYVCISNNLRADDDSFSNRCFNTNPDPEQTSHFTDATNAKSARLVSVFFSVFPGAFGYLFLKGAVSSPYPVNMPSHAGSGVFLPWGIESMAQAYRFNKVVKGDWIIEGTPPPEKKELKEETSVQDIVTQLFPQPTLAPIQS